MLFELKKKNLEACYIWKNTAIRNRGKSQNSGQVLYFISAQEIFVGWNEIEASL